MLVARSEYECLKRQYLRERGYFGEWNESLLSSDPEFLRDVMIFARSCEGAGCVSAKMRHLIWMALDAAVTHIFPFGIELHARLARESGAADGDILEALRIGCEVNGDVSDALAIVRDACGQPAPYGRGDYETAIDRLGGSAIGDPALDPRSRELIYVALYASTPLFRAEALRAHVEQALAAGASADELTEVVQIASGIAIHGLISAVPLLALEGAAQ
jgi:alkylhydroperoxidase/carboxymuconolactone decarboxylase family protein YurZ